MATSLILALALSAAWNDRAAAQATAADSAAVVLETARAFEAREQWEVADALYRWILERYGSTPAAAVARDRMAAATTRASSASGAVETQVWMSLYGAWLGIAVPAAFGSSDPEAYGAGLLVGGPLGFFAGRSLARSLSLTEGQARAVTLGGTWGTWQGFGWQEVFEWGVDERCDSFGGPEPYCYPYEDTVEETMTAMIVGGLAGIATGALIARRDISPGAGTLVNFGSLWGTWFGVALGGIADLEGDDLLAATLVGGDAALVATALLAPSWNMSRSRARLISIAGVLGGLAGAGVDLIVQPDDGKTALGIPLAGSVLGLTLGALTTRDRDDSRLGALDNGALIGLDGGRLAFGMPVPIPVRLPSAGPRGPRHVSALGLELFRASF